MARLTSSFYVAQLMRRINGASGFAVVAKAGADAAGAIYIAVRKRAGDLSVFGPAPQSIYEQHDDGDRLFQVIEGITTDQSLSAFQIREEKFDADFWIVEIEPSSDTDLLPFEIMNP